MNPTKKGDDAAYEDARVKYVADVIALRIPAPQNDDEKEAHHMLALLVTQSAGEGFAAGVKWARSIMPNLPSSLPTTSALQAELAARQQWLENALALRAEGKGPDAVTVSLVDGIVAGLEMALGNLPLSDVKAEVK